MGLYGAYSVFQFGAFSLSGTLSLMRALNR